MPIHCVRQPVILMGMSRSGTTLVAELLSRFGLFLGYYLRKDQESTFFYSANNDLLRRVHACWDHPAPMRDFFQDQRAVEMTTRCLEADLMSYRLVRFLGTAQYLRRGGLGRLDQPWGWKDPVNVFTLPLWLKLFPQAKVVFIVRNGVDAANSLAIREQKLASRRKREFPRQFSKIGIQSKLARAGFKGAVRCLSLEGCFSLWEEYNAQAHENLSAIKNDRIIIRYESFLADPKRHLLDLLCFCEVGLKDGADLDSAVETLDPGRAHAFVRDPYLISFYEKVKASCWMAQFGYANLPSDCGLDSSVFSNL